MRPDREQPTTPSTPSTPAGTPRPKFGRRPASAPPLGARPGEREPIAPRHLSRRRWVRALRAVALVAATAAILLAARLTLPAFARELPSCESQRVRDALIGLVRQELGAQNIAVTSVTLSGARKVADRKRGFTCRAELRVDRRALDLEYDVGWSNWLLGRYTVEARPVQD